MARCISLLVLPTLLGALTASGCHTGSETPGWTVLPDMMESVPYDSFGRHPELGLTMRRPPEGALPLGADTFDYGPQPEESLRAGREVTSPLADAEQSVLAAAQTRGERVYETFCLVCHGPGGDGDGPIIGRFPNPPSLHADKAKKLSDGAFFHLLVHGRGLMPPYAVQVDAHDRWNVIAFVRALQDRGAEP